MFINLNDESEPMLGTEYVSEDDNSSVTITLQEGTTWSDGTPLNADDVVFTCSLPETVDSSPPMLPGMILPEGAELDFFDSDAAEANGCLTLRGNSHGA